MAGHRSKAWIFGVAVALAVGGALFGGAKGLPAKAGPSCIGFSHGKYVSNVVFAGPDLQTLYVTAGDKVFRRHVRRKGTLPWTPLKPPQPPL